MAKCPFCEFQNEEGALFCEQCKSDLGFEPVVAAAPAQATAAPVVLVAMPVDAIPLAEAAAAAPSSAAIVAASTIPLAPLEVPARGTPAGVAEALSPRAGTLTPTPLEGLAPFQAGAVDGNPTTGIGSAPAAGLSPVEAARPSPGPTGNAGAAAEPLPPGAQPKLVVQRGLKIGMEYPLYEGHNFIGRADEKAVDIDLEDQESPERIWTSRQHALVTFEDGFIHIEDLNSSNGTFVNRNRVYAGERRAIQAGDVVQIGTVQMKLKV